MKAERTGLNMLAIFAILFLLGFGFVVYAVPGSALAPVPLDSNQANQNSVIYYHLVQVAPTLSPGGNASGYAGISVTGDYLSLAWAIKGALPGEELQMVMQVASSGGATKSFTFAALQVSAAGTAESSGSASLDPGTYMIGLVVIDPSTSSHKMVLTSVPTAAQVNVGSEITQTTTALGSSLSYSLLPLPVYLHQQAPSNYSFREGGALILVTGNTLQLTTSFLGSANTAFIIVVQTTGQNITAGTVATGSGGGAVFEGNVTLAPGTYHLGILVFSQGHTSSPVAISVPRAIEITLPLTTHTSTTTTRSSTTTKTSTSTSSSEHSSSTTSTASSTSSTATTSHSSELTNQLGFTVIPGAPHGYSYGQGRGGYAVYGGNIYFSLAFAGQNPSTHYSLSLSVNGSAKTIGDYTTTASGEGHVGASASLGTGRFLLSLTIVDMSSFPQPTAVLASDPSTFVVNIQATTTTTSIHTTTSSTTETPEGHSWIFKLVPAAVTNAPRGYHFATSGKGVVTLISPFSLLNVVVGFQDGNPSTTYNAALLLNGTSINIGTMTTNKAGSAELHASIQVNPGTYLLGLAVYDVSDIAAFRATGPVLVMLSDPNSQVAVMIPPARQSGSGESEKTTTQSSLSSSLKAVTTVTAEGDVEKQIRGAVDSLTIPATVQITPLSSSSTVLDSRFSVSVGQQVGNGLVIGISGENVTGPRVLLINMSKTSPLALYPTLNVTLDGAQVTEASSALQVLNPSPADPPRYVIVATATSIQLLVSIPHFSLHLVQIAGQIVHSVLTTLQLDAPILAGSLLVITLAFAGAYAARKRYFSIL